MMDNKEFNREEYNELCARFLGWEMRSYPSHIKNRFHGRSVWFSPPSSDGKTRTFCCVRGEEYFDCDWNWIHQVLEKIEELGFESLSGGGEYYYPEKGMRYIQSFIKDDLTIYSEGRTKMETAIEAIWKFLNWHNEKDQAH
jgi:hypothetical protein